MQMSLSAGTITSVTRRRVSASGSEPSATAPTESSRRRRSERPTERERNIAPAIATPPPIAIRPIRTASSVFPSPMFHSG